MKIGSRSFRLLIGLAALGLLTGCATTMREKFDRVIFTTEGISTLTSSAHECVEKIPFAVRVDNLQRLSAPTVGQSDASLALRRGVQRFAQGCPRAKGFEWQFELSGRKVIWGQSDARGIATVIGWDPEVGRVLGEPALLTPEFTWLMRDPAGVAALRIDPFVMRARAFCSSAANHVLSGSVPLPVSSCSSNADGLMLTITSQNPSSGNLLTFDFHAQANGRYTGRWRSVQPLRLLFNEGPATLSFDADGVGVIAIFNPAGIIMGQNRLIRQ